MNAARALVLLVLACGPPKPTVPDASAASRDVPPTGAASVRYDRHIGARATLPGDSARNPFAGMAQSAREGEQLFASMNCDGCHGGGAVGFVGPSLTDGRWRYGSTDAAIFQSIYYGRPQGMPAFGDLLAPEIIWKLLTYIRSLPPPKALPTQAW